MEVSDGARAVAETELNGPLVKKGSIDSAGGHLVFSMFPLVLCFFFAHILRSRRCIIKAVDGCCKGV